MFKRKIYEKLVEWKKESDGRTELLVEGARRIGKSTVVENFAKNEYESYILNDKLSTNLGYLDENVVAQILAANGNELFYYTFANPISKHNYEIDFLLARKNKLCPIEIKSSGYKTHKSLDAFSQKYSDRILWKYLVYTKDLCKDQDIICLPVYMAQFL